MHRSTVGTVGGSVAAEAAAQPGPATVLEVGNSRQEEAPPPRERNGAVEVSGVFGREQPERARTGERTQQ